LENRPNPAARIFHIDRLPASAVPPPAPDYFTTMRATCHTERL